MPTYTPKASEIERVLVRRRRRGPGARPHGHRGRPPPAGQAQADLRPPHRHRRPRHRHQRRQGRAHRRQGRARSSSTATRATRAASRPGPTPSSSTKPPEEAVRRIVGACSRRTASAAQMITKLKVYAGPTHPHAAQKPQPLELDARQGPRLTADLRQERIDAQAPRPVHRPPQGGRRPRPPPPRHRHDHGQQAARSRTTSRPRRTG